MESWKRNDQTSLRTELVGVMTNFVIKKAFSRTGVAELPLVEGQMTSAFWRMENRLYPSSWDGFESHLAKSVEEKKKNGNRTCNEMANFRSILKLKRKLFAFDSIRGVLLKEKEKKKEKKRKQSPPANLAYNWLFSRMWHGRMLPLEVAKPRVNRG